MDGGVVGTGEREVTGTHPRSGTLLPVHLRFLAGRPSEDRAGQAGHFLSTRFYTLEGTFIPRISQWIADLGGHKQPWAVGTKRSYFEYGLARGWWQGGAGTTHGAQQREAAAPKGYSQCSVEV